MGGGDSPWFSLSTSRPGISRRFRPNPAGVKVLKSDPAIVDRLTPGGSGCEARRRLPGRGLRPGSRFLSRRFARRSRGRTLPVLRLALLPVLVEDLHKGSGRKAESPIVFVVLGRIHDVSSNLRAIPDGASQKVQKLSPLRHPDHRPGHTTIHYSEGSRRWSKLNKSGSRELSSGSAGHGPS